MATNGFTFIPNQPIVFDLETDPCQGFLDKGRCVEYKREDEIEFQIKRNPCGDNLACEALADETFGDELVLNGTFATDLANWEVDAPFVWSAGKAVSDGSSYGYIRQTISILQPGNYTVAFGLTFASGSLVVSGYCTVPGTNISEFGTTYDTTGSYTVEIIAQEAGDYVIEFVGADSDVAIDNVSIRQRLSCYNGPGWYESDGGYQHLPGFNVALEAYDDVFTVGKYYKVVLSVSGMTDGSVVINVGSNASESITSDITSKAFYINSGTGTGFNIIPDTDFDGFVTIEQIYELTEVSYLYLVDLDLVEVADLSPFITYVADRVNVKFKISELTITGDSEGLVPNGCYRIAVRNVCNPANANLVINPEFLDGTTSFVEGWERNNGSYQYDTSGGGCTFLFSTAPGWSQFPILRNDINPFIIPGEYEVTIEIESNSDDANQGVTVKIDNSYEASPEPYYLTVGTHTFNITYVTPATEPIYGSPRVYLIANGGVFSDPAGTGNLKVASVTVRRIENNETLNHSNCIQIKSDAQLSCTKWIEGYGGCYGYGFDFRQFKLGMRIPILKDGPEYPIDQNTYLQSDGARKRTKGERDKVYRVVTDKISEIEHDVLSTMLICDTFLIDSVGYFFSGKNYSPDWPRNRRSSVARVEIDLVKDDVIMASDCGSCDAAPSFIPCTVFCETAIGLKSNYPEPSPAGWYMKDGENKLQYSNGTIYTATEKTCEGYINAFDQYGAFTGGGPWRWNNITSQWEAIMYLISVANDSPNIGEGTVAFKVQDGCIGRLQLSTDIGENWQNVSGYKSTAQLAAGVSFTKPVNPFRFRIEMKCAICLYYSQEFTSYWE